jgi:hypothetical protein
MNAVAERIDPSPDHDFLAGLNPQQRTAAEHGASEKRPGPLLVIAGASSPPQHAAKT